MKKIRRFFCLLFWITTAHAQTIYISEIAWMGTTNSSYDEWLELRNQSDEIVDLTDWQLASQDGTPSIKLTGTVEKYGFFLLERTDDTSAIPPADQIYTGSLNNSGETLTLKDSNGTVIDEVSGWSAGDNTTKQTMERFDPSTWQTSQTVNGTPKAENSAENFPVIRLHVPPFSLGLDVEKIREKIDP